VSDKEWYSNKELFEFIQELKTEFKTESELLKAEMQQTREAIRRYNGLREELAQVKSDVESLKAEARGRSQVGRAVREWGGWIAALLMVLATFWKVFNGGA
jgi:ferric-dicitrate binding protein FerR (iron transport regulator)